LAGIGVVADAAHLGAGDVRPVTGQIGRHLFERFVWPPGQTPADPEVVRTDGGCWRHLMIPTSPAKMAPGLRAGRTGKFGLQTRADWSFSTTWVLSSLAPVGPV
jgi:hypothetical protein